jgi:flagellar basal-body rod protein FlgF
MSKGIYVALSGAVAQETALATTATNVANSGTAGYQRLRPVFRDALVQARGGDRNVRYARVARTVLDGEPGAARKTGGALDVALRRGEYLVVATPDGQRYTRAGALSTNAGGDMVTPQGMRLLDTKSAPIRVNPKGGAVSISQAGEVVQDGKTIATLRRVTFNAPTEMEHLGGALLGAGAAGAPVDVASPVEVGVLEDSNASTVGAMTELMTASRTFEAFQRALDAFGEIDRKIVGVIPTTVD